MTYTPGSVGTSAVGSAANGTQPAKSLNSMGPVVKATLVIAVCRAELGGPVPPMNGYIGRIRSIGFVRLELAAQKVLVAG